MSQPHPDFQALSVAERIQLAEDIWDSIATGNPDSVVLSSAQRQEIRTRALAHDQDSSTALPWDQVRSELFQQKPLMQVLFRPEARIEALEAKAGHEARSVGLGLEFARSLDAALAAVFRIAVFHHRRDPSVVLRHAGT